MRFSKVDQAKKKIHDMATMNNFLHLLMNKNTRAALRTWKENTFGRACDPRIPLMVAAQKKAVQSILIDPIKLLRARIKQIKDANQARKQKEAQIMRENLKLLTMKP
jgi:hypothetical protein